MFEEYLKLICCRVCMSATGKEKCEIHGEYCPHFTKAMEQCAKDIKTDRILHRRGEIA